MIGDAAVPGPIERPSNLMTMPWIEADRGRFDHLTESGSEVGKDFQKVSKSRSGSSFRILEGLAP
jgi:hypothetical protein